MRYIEIEFNESGVRFWLVLIVLTLALWLVWGIWIPEAQFRAKVSDCKQKLHSVQLALERFAVDDPASNYPQDMNVLLSKKYMDQLPENPFTHQPMRAAYMDWRSDSGRWEKPPDNPGLSRGDFMYVRRYDAENEHITGYTLVLY